MRIAIVDDEQHCVDRLMSLLEPEISSGSSVHVFKTFTEAVVGIDTLQPEILFLDVQLHGKTGFDVLQHISFKGFSLIFTTAYEQYAVHAFKFSALDYLLKPLRRVDLSSALEQAKKRMEEKQFTEKLKVLFSHLSPAGKSKRISIATMEGYIFLEINRVIRCQADVNYTYIYTLDGDKYTASKTLKYFEDLLTEYNFFRVHNSHLINLEHVCKYNKGKGGYITLSDHSKIEVSTRRRDAFLQACRILHADL
ncbi:LytR/AlgR family response regulator transcription factor [Olivibacter jilunii]|uniref:LytR/AlgR family response regulator transcription factor n=1 Tax=Olivibacter jilunii TaxID=985016 RepID=UPI001031C11F|nr:LytTR family DNA-binding domain-containing protein [Olivibacter jilunii]